MKAAFIRYGLVVAAAIATVVLTIVYYGSGLYGGEGTLAPVRLPRGSEYLTFLALITLLIGLKYPVYDLVADWLQQRYRSRNLTALRHAAFTLALAVDLLSLSASLKPVPDAGFAIFAVIIVSPPILLISLIVLGVATWVARKRRS